MREIVLDTETTGLDPEENHRIVEIGAVELLNHLPTGRAFHVFINPERDMPAEAVNVHGLTGEFLSDKPVFAQVVAEFLEFIGQDRLVIHNAAFDAGFLNAELARLGMQPIPDTRLVDTLMLARKRYPGAQNSLDALCRRFGVDLSGREKHGAEIDCYLLAEVYLHLIGGRQPGLTLQVVGQPADRPAGRPVSRTYREPRPHRPTAEELAAHRAFVAELDNPIWPAGHGGA